MQFATLLLVTSTMVAPTAARPADGLGARPTVVLPPTLSRSITFDAQRSTNTTQQRERPHRFGLGGSVTASTRGASGAVRYWFSDHIGMDMSAGWFRSYYQTSNGLRSSTVQASPSVIWLITDPDPTRDVDIRPFVGGGVSYLRSRRPIMLPSGSATMSEASGTGMQAFGGAEITFKEADQVALSAELIYYRLPIRLMNINSIDGMNYLIAVHFYLK